MSKDKYAHISDKELQQRFEQTGNNEWLGILLERYTLLLFGVCIKYLKQEQDARDCVQQIFLKVIQEAGKYKIEYFKSWIYMVAKNQCLTILRNKKTKPPLELTEKNEYTNDDREPVFDIKERALSEGHLEEALKMLSAEQHECISLFYLKKKSYRQISEITGHSLQQIKSYIQNGKRNLRISIEKSSENA